MCRGGNPNFILSASGSCRMLGSPGLRSDLGGQFLSTQCFSRALLSHIHKKAWILGVCLLLTKMGTYHFKVNTDVPIVFVILQQFNDSLFMSPYSSRR